jgi:hypothetical protein
MKRILMAGVLVALASGTSNALEGVKFSSNLEAGWQNREINLDASGTVRNGSTTQNIHQSMAISKAKNEFRFAGGGMEAQYGNYVFGFKGDYSRVLARYDFYAGYKLNLSNLELKPYISYGYLDSSIDKGTIAGIGISGKVNLPHGFNVFLGGEYDKTISGESKWADTVSKDIKDTWDVYTGVGKKIKYGELYIKAFYREHKANTVNAGGLCNGISYKLFVNSDIKVSGIMVGFNF